MSSRGVSFLRVGETIRAGDYLVADNGSFCAVMQDDGNFCVFAGGTPADGSELVFDTQSSRAESGDYFAVMQDDGNFCVYSGTGPDSKGVFLFGTRWVSAPHGDYFAVIQDDGDFCVYSGAGPDDKGARLWSASQAVQDRLNPKPPRSERVTDRSVMRTGEWMAVGDSLVDESGRFSATLKNDGTLCVQLGRSGLGELLWSSEVTSDPPGECFAVMQDDGNLCVYHGPDPDRRGRFVWGTRSTRAASGEYFAVMQGDGNLCVYRGTGPHDQGRFMWGSFQSGSIRPDPGSPPVPADVDGVYRLLLAEQQTIATLDATMKAALHTVDDAMAEVAREIRKQPALNHPARTPSVWDEITGIFLDVAKDVTEGRPDQVVGDVATKVVARISDHDVVAAIKELGHHIQNDPDGQARLAQTRQLDWNGRTNIGVGAEQHWAGYQPMTVCAQRVEKKVQRAFTLSIGLALEAAMTIGFNGELGVAVYFGDTESAAGQKKVFGYATIGGEAGPVVIAAASVSVGFWDTAGEASFAGPFLSLGGDVFLGEGLGVEVIVSPSDWRTWGIVVHLGVGVGLGIAAGGGTTVTF